LDLEVTSAGAGRGRGARLVAAVALGALATLAGCTDNPVITLEIATPTGEGTFAGVTRLRARNTNPARESEAAYSATGAVTLDLTVGAGTGSTHVEVEGLDASGAVVARGASPPFDLGTLPSYLRIYVARIGGFGQAPLVTGTAPAVRTDAAVTAVAGLGALVAGGGDASGAPVSDTWVYDEYLHVVTTTGGLGVARAGATAIDIGGGSVLVFGGLTAAGPSSALEEFQPLVGVSGTFAAILPDGDASLARAFAPAVAIGGGLLVAGGTGAGGAPLATSVLLTTTPAIGATAIGAPMQGPRSGHTLTPTGDGLFALVWGLPQGAAGWVAEQYRPTSQLFTVVPNVDAPLGRTGHTATLLADGRTLIIGGANPAGTITGDIIELSADLTKTTVHAGVLEARASHTTTLLGATLLVAGGHGAAGPLGDAELVDTTTLAVGARPALQAARTGHAAVLLGSGTVLLVGGRDANGAPVQTLELYTPVP
jgi:hypothetical protein